MATYRISAYHTMADAVVPVRFTVPGRAKDHTPEQIAAALEAKIAETWVQPHLAAYDLSRVTKV